MKKLIYIFVLFTIVGFSQSSDTPLLKYFVGGEINFNMHSSINTMGGGIGSGGFGRVIAPGISYGPASIFTNPAEIGLVNSATVYLDTKFDVTTQMIGLDINDELNKSISRSTDSFLKDTKTFIFNSGNPRSDTKINQFNFGQDASFSALALSVPVSSKTVLGFGAYYPIDFSTEFLLTGMKMKIEQIKKMGNQTVSIAFPISASFASNFRLSVNSISLGAATELLNTNAGRTIVGASVNRYEVAEYLNFNLQIDGMMVLNKNQEYHFNDPNDANIDRSIGESNDFYWLARGNYKTNAWGFRIGVIQKMEKTNISLTFDYVPTFTLTDNNYVNKSFQPKFFTGRVTGDKDEALAIDMNSLDLARPNLTVPTKNSFSSQLETSYPSSISLGADTRWGDFTFAFNAVKYLSEFSFTFDRYRIGKDMNFATKFSVDVQLADKLKGWGFLFLIPRLLLFADFDGFLFQIIPGTGYKEPHYRGEGGVVFGDAIAEGFGDPDMKKSLNDAFSLPFPTGLAISREYSIFERVRVGVMVFGFPDFALRQGISFAF